MCDKNAMSANAASWLDQVRAKKGGRQYPETRKMIAAFESFAKGVISPEEAAQDVASALEPLIKSNPASFQITLVWNFVFDAIRAEGSNMDVSKRVIRFIEAMRRLEVKGENGEIIEHPSGGKFWTDLPGFSTAFDDCFTVERTSHMDSEEGLTHATWYQNATYFAALALSDSSNLPGLCAQLVACLGEALDDISAEPSPVNHAEFYVPAASAWILVAGRMIFELCRTKLAEGLSIQKWEEWKKSFIAISDDGRFHEESRSSAKKAADEMKRIFRI